MVKISGIEEELERVLDNRQLLGSCLPSLLGDSIWEIRTVITTQNYEAGLIFSRGNVDHTSQENVWDTGKSLSTRLRRKLAWKMLQLGERAKQFFLRSFSPLHANIKFPCWFLGKVEFQISIFFDQISRLSRLSIFKVEFQKKWLL